MLKVDQCPPQETLTRLRNNPAPTPSEISWPDVLVNAHYRKLEKEIPESAFTIFSVVNDGYVHINMNHKSFRFCKETLFLVNPYESFSYQVHESKPLHMVNIHLSLDTYQHMTSAILLNDDALLDDPEEVTSYTFNNHIHFNRPTYKSRMLGFSDQSMEDYQLELMDTLSEMILDDQYRIKCIASQRMSTRKELYKRVAMGKTSFLVSITTHHSP